MFYDGVMTPFLCPEYSAGHLQPGCSSGLHVPRDCKAWSSWSWPRLPVGLEDVSKYPDLIAELLRRNWTETEVRGVLSDNLLRVFSAVEQVRRAQPSGFPVLPPLHPQGRLPNLGSLSR